MNTDPIKCEECGAYTGHRVGCSKTPPDQLRKQLDDYYNAWVRLGREQSANYLRWSSQVTLWQGKCAILKHENNKLRNKLRKAGIIK